MSIRTLLLLLFSVGTCNAAVTLNAVADTFVTTGPANSLTTKNYGAGGALGVSAALTNGTFNSVIRFDVSTAVAAFNTQFGAGNWNLSSVQLALATTTPNNAMFNGTTNGGAGNANIGGQFNVSWFGSDSWLEGSGTPSAPTGTGIVWNDIAALVSGAEAEGTFTYNPSTSGPVTYNLANGTALNADLMAGGLVSFYLAPADSSVSALFASRTNPTAGNRPTLTLSAVAAPEPGRAVLLVFGFMALLTRRQRR